MSGNPIHLTGWSAAGMMWGRPVVDALVIYRLPGGSLATETFREAVEVAASAARLLGPWAWGMTALAGTAVAPALERRWARALVGALRIDLDIEGIEHIDIRRPYLVAPLHEGFADVPALLHLPLPLRFVARQELAAWHVLGRYLGRSRHVLIDPESPRAAYRKLLAAIPEAIAARESPVVFPQGSILGIEVAFRRGVFDLADRFGLPVLPVVVTGSHQVWEHPFSPLVRLGRRISVRILSPVPVGEASRRAAETEATMKQVALGPDMAPARRFDPVRDGFWDGYHYEIDRAFPEVVEAVQTHRLTPV